MTFSRDFPVPGKMSPLLGLISADLEWLLGKHWAPPQKDKVLIGPGREELPQDQLWALQHLNFVLLLWAPNTRFDFLLGVSLYLLFHGALMHKLRCSDKSCRWEVRECEVLGCQGSPGQESKDGELCGRNILATSTAKRQTQESTELFKLSLNYYLTL